MCAPTADDVVELRQIDGGTLGPGAMLLWECPGCGFNHGPWVAGERRPRWLWNGSLTHPTLSPSVLVRTRQGDREIRCHLFLIDGECRFLPDSTHALAGRTVSLPPIRPRA